MISITPINPHCLVIGQAHCTRFFEMLSARQTCAQRDRVKAWRALEDHLTTCPECLAWQQQPQPELEDEE